MRAYSSSLAAASDISNALLDASLIALLAALTSWSVVCWSSYQRLSLTTQQILLSELGETPVMKF